MRYITAAFIVWILLRKRLGVYTALATSSEAQATNTTSQANP